MMILYSFRNENYETEFEFFERLGVEFKEANLTLIDTGIPVPEIDDTMP